MSSTTSSQGAVRYSEYKVELMCSPTPVTSVLYLFEDSANDLGGLLGNHHTLNQCY
jgi:hypothetical protein